jgi:uncharacterized protein YgiB involved in biofilm formation
MKPRKRSVYVGFSLITLSAAALASCGPERAPDAKDVQIYKSVDDCARIRPRADCEAAWAQAKAEEKDSPNFRDRTACEKDWGSGKCEERRGPSGASMFIPALVGFTMGQALAGGMGPRGCAPGDPRCAPNGGPGGYGGGHGVYVGATGGLFAGKSRIGDAEMRGGSYEPPRTAAVRVGEGGRLSAGVTRGGFGRMAGFRGGGGRGG